jgi:hypothetical protein
MTGRHREPRQRRGLRVSWQAAAPSGEALVLAGIIIICVGGVLSVILPWGLLISAIGLCIGVAGMDVMSE